MTKALISIDYSYDFVADDGKLTAGKPAQAIEDRIAQVTQEAYDNGDYIFVYDAIKDDHRVFWMDKRHYSAFSGTDLDIRLRERRVTTVVLTGVLTDICVLHTAIDAYNLGYDIEVVESATASLTTEAHDFAIGHFKNVLGATIVE